MSSEPTHDTAENLLSNHEKAVEERCAALLQAVTTAYEELAKHRGDQQARQDIETLLKRTPGAPRGSRNPERDQELLDLFDRERETRMDVLPRSIPRLLAAALHKRDPRRFGPSPEAIERHIRRLDAKRRRDAAEMLRTLKEWNDRLSQDGPE